MHRAPTRRSALLITAAAVVMGLAPALTGCSFLTKNLTRNVRAEREYGNENPELDVVLHRLDDAEAALNLVDKVLAKVPYEPGDAWPRDIALKEARAEGIKKDIAKAPPYARDEHEIPVLSVYRVHLDQVLRRAEAPRKPAKYASVLDALATLSPGASSIKAQWERVKKAEAARAEAIRARTLAAQEVGSLTPRYAEAEKRVAAAEKEAEKARHDFIVCAEALRMAPVGAPEPSIITRDALSVTSVALRVLQESGALMSAVVDQAQHVYTSAERDIFEQHGKDEMARLAALPPRAAAVKARTDGEAEAVEPAAEALASVLDKNLYAAPGFELKESIIDQFVGIQLDSVRLRLRGDGEVLFFNQIGVSGETNPGYVGQTRRLAYDVDPVGLIGARLIVTFDWIHVKNAARLNAGFATDRIWGQGGDIVNSASLGQQLGFEGFASDMFDIGMDLLGVRVKAKSATFTSGEVREIAVDPGTGRDMGTTRTAPLKLAFTQIDVGYDVAFLLPELPGKYWLEELLLGFRYMNYRLPRILYELEDVDADPEVSRYAFSRESPAQTLDSKYFMGGLAARFGQGDKRAVSLFGDLGIYGGSGPMAFYFLKDAAAGDTPGNRSELSPAMLVFNGSAGLGVRLRFTPRRSRFRVLLEAQYHAEVVGQAIVSEIRETRTEDSTTYTIGKTINYGGVDVYHGPRLQLVGVF